MARALPRQDTRQADAIRQELEKLRRDKKKAPQFDGEGQFLEGIVVPAGGSIEVAHLLKSKPRGISMATIPRVTVDGNPIEHITVFEVDGLTSETHFTLANAGTHAVTVSVWVF